MSPHHRPPTIVIVTFGLAGVLLAPAPLRAQGTPPPETIEYYATDALGSVRVVFTPTGQVIGRSDYLPFGETFTQSGALPHQRFTGQERDGEAGLDDFNARSLQVRTGRMNRPDPLFAGAMGNPQGWNRYAYVANNPLRMTDPSGMAPSDSRSGPFFDSDQSVLDSLTFGPGYSPENASGRSMFASDWTDEIHATMEAQRPKPQVTTQTGMPSVGPTLGIGIEVPASSAVQGNVLNAAADPGHTFIYFADASGIVGILSFGPGEPIGLTNKSQFSGGTLPGNANWGLTGDAATWSFPITQQQFAAGLAAVDAFKAQVPNYTPDMQCTSAALSIAAKTGLSLPSGVGPVIAREYGVTGWSGNVANPYALNQQMTARFGQPTVVNTSVFRRR